MNKEQLKLKEQIFEKLALDIDGNFLNYINRLSKHYYVEISPAYVTLTPLNQFYKILSKEQFSKGLCFSECLMQINRHFQSKVTTKRAFNLPDFETSDNETLKKVFLDELNLCVTEIEQEAFIDCFMNQTMAMTDKRRSKALTFGILAEMMSQGFAEVSKRFMQ